jgi:phosphatidylserine decarboxylase
MKTGCSLEIDGGERGKEPSCYSVTLFNSFFSLTSWHIAQYPTFVLQPTRMTIHKEGYKTIAIATIVFGVINILSFYLLSLNYGWLSWLIFVATLALLVFLVSFFRIPNRTLTIAENAIVAPADGTVVVIEEVQADEYFTDRRMQVSIFMSPLNVHVNRNPVSGEVMYSQYHKGKYLVAWHPKSSTENERHSVVYKKNGKEILVKQIAGALAKRIVNYLQPGQQVQQTAEMGFIKLGSRVDLLLPLDAKINVKIGDKPQGGVTVVAEW